MPLAPARQTPTRPDAEASAERVTAEGGVGVALRLGLFYGRERPHAPAPQELSEHDRFLGEPS